MSFKRNTPTKRKSEPHLVARCKGSNERHLILNWNGRAQFVGVVQLRNGRLFRLEEPGDKTSRRTPITEYEKDELVTRATLANVERRKNVDDHGNLNNLTDLHWDCSDADTVSQFQLVPDERGEPRTERDLYGHLDVDILVGDRVKVALNVGFAIGCTFASAEDNVSGELPDAMVAQLAKIEENMGAEKYWAHVLAVEGEQNDTQKLTILSPSSLTYLVSPVASEPYVVERKCAYAHHASSLGRL